jgi:hypothetical protein
MMVYWIDYAFSTISKGPETSYVWRVPTIMQCIFLLPMIILVLIIPETPRWLAGHDRNEECFEVLRRMHCKKMTDAEIRAEYEMIVGAVALEASAGASSWKGLLRSDRKSRKDCWSIFAGLTGLVQTFTPARDSLSLAASRSSSSLVASTRSSVSGSKVPM